MWITAVLKMSNLQLVEDKNSAPALAEPTAPMATEPTAQAIAKPTIDQLRALIGVHERHQKNTASFSLYEEGFAAGTVAEIYGHGKTEFLTHFLREHRELKVAWVEPEMTINPYALHQRQVDLKNVLFIEAQKEMAWCLGQALQSGCFQVLVVSGARFSERELRRFQLLSERAASHFFLLSEKPHSSWVPSVQIEVQKSRDNLRVITHKRRGVG